MVFLPTGFVGFPFIGQVGEDPLWEVTQHCDMGLSYCPGSCIAPSLSHLEKIALGLANKRKMAFLAILSLFVQ